MCDLYKFKRSEEISCRINGHFPFISLQFCIICYMFAILSDHLEILAARAVRGVDYFAALFECGLFVQEFLLEVTKLRRR